MEILEHQCVYFVLNELINKLDVLKCLITKRIQSLPINQNNLYEFEMNETDEMDRYLELSSTISLIQKFINDFLFDFNLEKYLENYKYESQRESFDSTFENILEKEEIKSIQSMKDEISTQMSNQKSDEKDFLNQINEKIVSLQEQLKFVDEKARIEYEYVKKFEAARKEQCQMKQNDTIKKVQNKINEMEKNIKEERYYWEGKKNENVNFLDDMQKAITEWEEKYEEDFDFLMLEKKRRTFELNTAQEEIIRMKERHENMLEDLRRLKIESEKLQSDKLRIFTVRERKIIPPPQMPKKKIAENKKKPKAKNKLKKKF